MYDLVIRNGNVYDGLGGEPFRADIAVSDGIIRKVGKVEESGAEEIDAKGMMVTPGFVDVHTHYDGQLTWSNQVSPSSNHGVTTVVTGNCGVGFAPCKPEDRTRLVKLLEGVEDIPEIVTTEGLKWDWQSFPEFIEALQRRPHDIDFAVQLPHAAVRVFVMGERAVDGEASTEDERRQMREIAREAIEAGAIGFGTSRSIFHRSPDGSIIPTAHAEREELNALADGVRDAGGGVMQVILDLFEPSKDLRLVRQVAREHGLPVSFSLVQTGIDADNWRDLLDQTEEGRQAGETVHAQALPRPIGFLLGLDTSFNPFSAYPAYQKIEHLPLAERVAEMRKPEVRAEILADSPIPMPLPTYEIARNFPRIFPLGNPPCYEPTPDNSIAARAEAAGVTPEEIAYDLLLEEDGHAILLLAAANYENGTLDPVREMILHPNAIPALGDGGAHYGMICDSTYTTFMLTHWGRDRTHDRIPLARIVEGLTSRPAKLVGMNDRGVIAEGKKANLNVIDFDRLHLDAPRVVRDLPAGGRRLTQEAEGYVATIVAGEVIMRDGQPTGALPGAMVKRQSTAAAQPRETVAS